MRTSAVRGIVAVVERERTRLTVEIEPRTEPISGQILDAGGRAHEFSGYMGLIEAFERLRPSLEQSASPGSSDVRPEARA